MKRLITFLCIFGILLCSGCGEAGAHTASLPDVLFLDEPSPSAAPAAERAVPAASPVPTGIPTRTVRAERETPEPSPQNTPVPAETPMPSPEPTEMPVVTPDPALCPYVGSRNSEVYHIAGCSQAARIKAENLVGWESAAAAEAAGRKPCGVCHAEKLPEPEVIVLSETPEPVPEETAAPEKLPANTPEPTPQNTPVPSPEPTEMPVVTPDPALCPYVGSRNSEVYHIAGCSQAARIKAENLVGWESAEAAEAAGRRPCGVCHAANVEETETVVPIETPGPSPEQPEERTLPGEYAYVGSRSSDKYHLPSCRYAQKISEENRIGWASREEAEAAGYQPCRTCNP